MPLGRESPRLHLAIRRARDAAEHLKGLGPKFEQEREALMAAAEAASRQQLVVAIVGSSKRGKSTLVNGLLGRHDDVLAPVGRFPATNVISRFVHSTAPSIHVTFADGKKSPITEPEIRDYACEDHNPGNRKGVKTIDVAGRFTGVDPRILLVDLPGSDSAQFEQHAQVLYEFLPQVHAVIFLMAADDPVNASEQALLGHIKMLGVQGIFFAINKRDYIREGELDQVEFAQGARHNRRIIDELGFTQAPILEISARDLLDGRPDSGVELLVDAIQKFIDDGHSDRIAMKLERETKLVYECAASNIGTQLALARETREQLDERRNAVSLQIRSLRSGRGVREARFRADWDAALGDFCDATRKVGKSLAKRYDDVIATHPAAGLTSLLQTIHTDVQAALREHLSSEIDRCNQRCQAAVAALAETVDQGALGIRSPAAPAAAISTAGGLKRPLEIGLAATPGIATGAAFLAAPAVAGSIIASAAPVIAATANPLTWLPAAAASLGSTAVGAAQSVVVATLGAAVLPLSIAAVCMAGHRSYRTWKNLNAQERNQLRNAVAGMINDAVEELVTQAGAQQRLGHSIVAKFHEACEDRLTAWERELVAAQTHPAGEGQSLILAMQHERLIEASRELSVLPPRTDD